MKRNLLFLVTSVVLCCFGILESTTCYGQPSRWGLAGAYSRKDVLDSASTEHFNAEQLKAVNALFDRYDKEAGAVESEVNRVLPNLPYTPDGKSGIRSIERIEFRNKKMEVLNRKFAADYKRIADWKDGKNPDDKQKPQQKQPPKSSAEEKLANAEEAFPNNPHDKLEKIPGMNLSPAQKKDIGMYRKVRQQIISKTVSKLKIKKNSVASRRGLFRYLKFIIYLYNYRIERQLNVQQIRVLRKYQGVPVEIDRLEDLLAGATPEEIFATPNDTKATEWNDGKSAEETGERLTRTNWHTFDEFRNLLNLNDNQMMALEGFDGEAMAANDAAIEEFKELKYPTDIDIRNICDRHAERFALVNDRIRSKMQRNQMEKFNVLQLLLLDVQELPETNMASVYQFELSDKDKKNLNAAVMFFVQDKNNLKIITDSNSVSVEQQKKAQKALEQKVKLQLTQSGINKWEKIVAENKELLNTIRKYKER
jgi:hypothetical protein